MTRKPTLQSTTTTHHRPAAGSGASSHPIAATTLHPGYVVAVTLKADAAPLRCYVGAVQAVDGHGVRLTLIDWFTGTADSWDAFFPWESITSALVATPDHAISRFGESAGNWQTACNAMIGGGHSKDGGERPQRGGDDEEKQEDEQQRASRGQLKSFQQIKDEYTSRHRSSENGGGEGEETT